MGETGLSTEEAEQLDFLTHGRDEGCPPEEAEQVQVVRLWLQSVPVTLRWKSRKGQSSPSEGLKYCLSVGTPRASCGQPGLRPGWQHQAGVLPGTAIILCCCPHQDRALLPC